MNISIEFTVWCEGDCDEWSFCDGNTKKRAESEARRMGWVIRKGKTLCPKCAASTPRRNMPMTEVTEDAAMIYDGQVVTLRDYRTLIAYERHVTIWAHFCYAAWRRFERMALAARKREAGRLMKRLGIKPANSWR